MFKGKKEYDRYKAGETLTRKEAILAHCYVCNGLEEGGEDCLGKSCPLYRYMPYRSGLTKTKRAATPQQLKNLRLARSKKKAAKAA